MAFPNVSVSLQARSEDASGIDPNIIISFISDISISQYFNVFLATILIYHSIITLDKEIKYFWPNPTSSVSIIYFLNRYVGLLGSICNITGTLFSETLSSCLFSAWIGGLASVITVVLIDYILLIRVLAFYHRNVKMVIVLMTLLGLEACVGLGSMIYSTLIVEIDTIYISEGITVCIQDGDAPPALAFVSWSTPMAYEFILLGLAMYKAAEYWRLSSGFKGFHLVRVLVQDQVIYFGFVIFCTVCQIISNSILDPNPFAADVLAAASSPTLLCILGGQLLINLKEAGERGANGGTNYTPRSVSNIDFGQNGGASGQASEGEGSV